MPPPQLPPPLVATGTNENVAAPPPPASPSITPELCVMDFDYSKGKVLVGERGTSRITKRVNMQAEQAAELHVGDTWTAPPLTTSSSPSAAGSSTASAVAGNRQHTSNNEQEEVAKAFEIFEAAIAEGSQKANKSTKRAAKDNGASIGTHAKIARTTKSGGDLADYRARATEYVERHKATLPLSIVRAAHSLPGPAGLFLTPAPAKSTPQRKTAVTNATDVAARSLVSLKNNTTPPPLHVVATPPAFVRTPTGDVAEAVSKVPASIAQRERFFARFPENMQKEIVAGLHTKLVGKILEEEEDNFKAIACMQFVASVVTAPAMDIGDDLMAQVQIATELATLNRTTGFAKAKADTAVAATLMKRVVEQITLSGGSLAAKLHASAAPGTSQTNIAVKILCKCGTESVVVAKKADRPCSMKTDLLAGTGCDCAKGPWLGYHGNPETFLVVPCHHFNWVQADLAVYTSDRVTETGEKLDVVHVILPGRYADPATFKGGDVQHELPDNVKTHISASSDRRYYVDANGGGATYVAPKPPTLSELGMFDAISNAFPVCGWEHENRPTAAMFLDMRDAGWTKRGRMVRKQQQASLRQGAADAFKTRGTV